MRQACAVFWLVVFLLGLGSPAWGAISQIEVVAAAGNGANPAVATITFGTATTSGELVVVAAVFGGNAVAPTVAGCSATFTQVYLTTIASNTTTSLFYAQNVGSGCTTVTVTAPSGNTHGGAIIGHYTGIATSSALDQNGGNPTVTSSPWSSATVTTTQASELLVGSDYAAFVSANCDTTATGSWNQDGTLTTGANFDGNNGSSMAYAHQIVSSIQTNIQNTGTNSTSCNNYAGIATFKAAAAVTTDTSFNAPIFRSRMREWLWLLVTLPLAFPVKLRC
jgi:hypothetical protein